jgi:uncharacterized membrane protein
MGFLFASLALMPMSLYLMPSVSADALTNGVALLYVAYVVKLASSDGLSLTRRRFAILNCLGVALCLVKPGYATLALLSLGISPRVAASRGEYWIKIAIHFGTICACSVGWAYLSGLSYSPLLDSWYAPAKVQQIAHDPAFLCELAQVTFSPQMLCYLLRRYAGCLGWNDLLLPVWFLVVYYSILLSIAIFAPAPAGVRFGVRLRSASGVALAIGSWVLSLIVYVSSTPIGTHTLYIQARYAIPLGPLFFVCIAGVGRRFEIAQTTRRRLVIAWFMMSILLLLYVASLLNRHYGP